MVTLITIMNRHFVVFIEHQVTVV